MRSLGTFAGWLSVGLGVVACSAAGTEPEVRSNALASAEPAKLVVSAAAAMPGAPGSAAPALAKGAPASSGDGATPPAEMVEADLGAPEHEEGPSGDLPAQPATPTPYTVEWPSAEQYAIGLPKPLPGARIYSKVTRTWIRRAPGDGGDDWLGYLALGDSVRVKDGDPEKAFAGNGRGRTCREWYAVEPVGYVCVGQDATLDPKDPVVVELLARTKANTASAWPYRYAESQGAPLLASVKGMPTLETVAEAPGIPPLLPIPRPIRSEIVYGSMVAFTDEFEVGGRQYLLTWDRGVVETNRVKVFQESHFHGLPVGQGSQLPIAFVRHNDGGEQLKRNADGAFEPLPERLPRLSWLELTGKTEPDGKDTLHETRHGVWLRGAEIGVAREAPDLPHFVKSATKGRKTWVDISILQGTLVAYEDRTPVYVTLISPGRGGLPVPGKTTLSTASTPTGVFHVFGKFASTTMVSSSNEDFIHSEVQYTQPFSGPYALHAAYWHDRWGQKKSAGCVNLSPTDARRLYAWSDPPVPEGWHGMMSPRDVNLRTVVQIHR